MHPLLVKTTGGSSMKKVLLSAVVALLVVFAAGCVGKSTGLTEEKVIHAIKNIKTAHYDENFTMAMDFTLPEENMTVNLTMNLRITAMLDRVNKRALGNYTGWAYYNGLNISFNWPVYIEGNDTYFQVNHRWYNATDKQESGSGSYNLDAIRSLLNSTNVTILPIADGYQFKLNLSFEQFANATGRTYALDKLFRLNGSVKTNEGWVLVKLKNDGTPYYIETYFDLTLMIPDPITKESVPVHLRVHDREALTKINEPVIIKRPEGIENAPPFNGLWG